MAPFDAPALEAAQIEIKKINAAGGVDGRPLEIKPLNDQLDPTQTKSDALKLVDAGRQHRLGHLRRRLRDAGDPGVPGGQAADGLAVHRHRPDGAVALRHRRPARLHLRQPGPAGRRGDGRVRATAAAGRRPTSSPTSCSCTSRTSAPAFTRPLQAARRQDRRPGVLHPGRQDDQQRRHPRQRQEGERDRVLHVVRQPTSRRSSTPAHARQQDADHRRLGQRRRLLVVEEPEDHQLLLPHLRVGADAGSVRPRSTRSRRR